MYLPHCSVRTNISDTRPILYTGLKYSFISMRDFRTLKWLKQNPFSPKVDNLPIEAAPSGMPSCFLPPFGISRFHFYLVIYVLSISFAAPQSLFITFLSLSISTYPRRDYYKAPSQVFQRMEEKEKGQNNTKATQGMNGYIVRLFVCLFYPFFPFPSFLFFDQ